MALIAIRWIISLLGTYACALVYTQRAGISVAIVAMTVAPHLNLSSASLTPKNYECHKQYYTTDSNLTTNESSYEFLRANLNVSSNVINTRAEFEWNAKLQVCLCRIIHNKSINCFAYSRE